MLSLQNYTEKICSTILESLDEDFLENNNINYQTIESLVTLNLNEAGEQIEKSQTLKDTTEDLWFNEISTDIAIKRLKEQILNHYQ